MKRFLFLLSCLSIGLFASAQAYKVDLDATLLKNFEKFKKGEKVKVLKGDFIDEFVKDIYNFLEEKSE